MSKERARAKHVDYENAREHSYKKYESHRYWKLLNKGISDLVGNQDLIEKAARPYIVGYLCKLLLSSPMKQTPK